MSYIEKILEPNPREVLIDNSTQEIYIQILVGNGQIGTNQLFINNEEFQPGDLTNKLFVCEGRDAENTELAVNTIVMDVNTLTDRCVITTIFSDQDANIIYQKVDRSVAEPNGIIAFRGKYLFRQVILLFFLFLNMLRSYGQIAQTTFKDLEAPSSPGFILYENTPEAIERPTTPQGLAISGVNAFQNGGSIEFSPFWLLDNPNFTAQKMITNKTPVLSQLSISFSYIDEDSMGHIAIGAKTRLIQVYRKETQRGINTLSDTIRSSILRDYLIRSKYYNLLEENKVDSARIIFVLDSLDNVTNELSNSYSKMLEEPLFHIDLTLVLGGTSITNSISNLNSDKYGVWLSASLRPKSGNFVITSVARISSNIVTEEIASKPILDCGIRINYEIQAFTFSSEYLVRKETDYSDRLAIIGAYKLSENLYFTGSLGQNFGDTNNLFMLGGISFGYSKNIKNNI